MRFSNDSSSNAALTLVIGVVFAAASMGWAEGQAVDRSQALERSTSQDASPALSTPKSLDAPPASFAELLEGFARTIGLEARFEEEKHLGLLAVPLRSRGRLYFAPPATLLRRVESPNPQDVLVVNDQVRIRDSGGEQTLDLASRDEVRPLVESMLWIFNGDLDSLERTYHVDYARGEAEGGTGDRDDADADDGTSASGRWRVTLVPRSEPLSQLISALEVRGRGRVADALELRETGGDRTITRILDVDPMRRFDADERRALFGVSDADDAAGATP